MPEAMAYLTLERASRQLQGKQEFRNVPDEEGYRPSSESEKRPFDFA